MALAPGTLVWTSEGIVPVESLRDRTFQAANGAGFATATVRAVDPRGVYRTKLDNGLELVSGRAQSFRVVPADSDSGLPEWRSQGHLCPGDRVLMDYRRTDCALDPALFQIGLDYGGWTPGLDMIRDPRLWTMLGFARADGYYPDATQVEDSFRFFIYDVRDRPMIPASQAFCEAHGIDAIATESEHPMLSVFHFGFQRWLRDFGFRGASDGVQNIPTRLFAAPAFMREAFLTGYFSAHGEWRDHSEQGYAAPMVNIPNPRLRQDILRLLWSVGVAASVWQRGWERRGMVVVRDIPAFQDQIGFMQAHKSRKVRRARGREGKWDMLPPQTTLFVREQLRSAKGWRGLSSEDRNRILRLRYEYMGLRRPAALDYYARLKLSPPEVVRFHHAEVDVCDERPLAAALLYQIETLRGEAPHFIAQNMVLK